VRRHAEYALSLEIIFARGHTAVRADLVECLLINLTSAVVLATVDGAPLSGCWS